MNKVDRLQRILRLLGLLQSDLPLGPHDLARKLNVSARTIYRDLKLLQHAGYDFIYDDNLQKYVAYSTTPHLKLETEDMKSLMLAANHLSPESGSLASRAIEAVGKIMQWLPQKIQQQCTYFASNFSISEYPQINTNHQKLFNDLQEALEKRLRTKIKYTVKNSTIQQTTILSPYHLRMGELGWQIIGYSTLHHKVINLSAPQIGTVELLAERYVIPSTFNIQDLFKFAWSANPEGQLYQVSLRFQPAASYRVLNVRWHSTQKITIDENGYINFEVKVDGLQEIVWWIIGFGDLVEVLEPATLRHRVADITGNMYSLYHNKASRCGTTENAV